MLMFLYKVFPYHGMSLVFVLFCMNLLIMLNITAVFGYKLVFGVLGLYRVLYSSKSHICVQNANATVHILDVMVIETAIKYCHVMFRVPDCHPFEEGAPTKVPVWCSYFNFRYLWFNSTYVCNTIEDLS